ncbi:MAG: carboxypeptidase regulatory-like domain-containing protein [Lentimicrobium sp.]
MKTRIKLFAALIVLVANVLSGCKKDEEEIQPKDFEYAENLLVIDSTELITITTLNDQGNIVLPSGTSLSGKFQVGMIIAGGISNATPYGFLKKITGISSDGSNTTVTTENATFEDAFINASVNFSRQLSISDISGSNNFKKGIRVKSSNGEGFFIEAEDVVLWDDDGNPATTGDQIKADGSFFMDPTVNFDFDVRNRRLEEVYFSLQNVQTTELTVFVGSEILSRETEYSLARITMNPIYIQAGLVPIVVVPVLEVTVGAKVEVNVRVQTEVVQSSTLEYGVQYQNGTWEPISHAEMSFSYQPPQLSASVEVKGYFGPQFNLLLYGIAGPYTDANAFLKLEADVFENPWWTLYGGGEVGVGVQVDFLGKTIADFYLPNVLNYQQTIAQANGGTEGTIKGSVKDAITQTGLANVLVNVKRDNQYSGTTESDNDGQFFVTSPVGENIVVEFTKSGYLPVTYQNVSVSVNEDTFLEPVLQIDDAHGGIGSISGFILNALDGSGISGCTLNLRSGINATEGFVAATGSTGNDGSFSIQGLPAGHYTIQAQRQGFTESYFTVVCIGGQNQGNQNGTMTPILNEDEIRIILTWGDAPADLDSHLTGPAEDGNRFHVYYSLKTYYQNGLLNAALDYDDVSSFGPETVSIYELSQGVYRYSVHDFSNRAAGYSMELSNSSAQVRVYQGSTLIANFNVPSNTEGTLWTVFEMSNGQIMPVNVLSYVSSPGAITTPSANNDLQLFRNLPAKK